MGRLIISLKKNAIPNSLGHMKLHSSLQALSGLDWYRALPFLLQEECIIHIEQRSYLDLTVTISYMYFGASCDLGITNATIHQFKSMTFLQSIK